MTKRNDITSPVGEPILATMDGSVIITDSTIDFSSPDVQLYLFGESHTEYYGPKDGPLSPRRPTNP